MTLHVQPLDIMFNACVQTICKRVWPQWFDVSQDAPDTLEKLQAEYAERGRITVWEGASDKTIFGDPQINHMFRAWHDWCHLMGRCDFSIEGEQAAACMQMEHVKTLFGDGDTGQHFCRIIEAEVIGQALYEQLHSSFPEDQMQFVKAYLKYGRATALTMKF